VSLRREEERRLIAAWRERLAGVSPAELRRDLERLRATLPVSTRDQLDAAKAETHRLFLRLQGPTLPYGPAWGDSPAGAALVAAALARCRSRCEHVELTHAPRPLVACLAPRVIACRACLPRYRGALVAAARRIVAGADRDCDWCAQEPADGIYRPMAVEAGHAILIGDACRACAGDLLDGARAARNDTPRLPRAREGGSRP
jgi:hypothetical protein